MDKWLGTVGNSVADVEEYAGLVRIVSESGQKAAAAIFRRVPTSDILNALCSRIERQAVDPAPPGYYRMYSGIALPVRPIRRALRHAYESATNHQRKESLVRAWDELSPASEELKAAFTKELFLKLMKDDAKKTRMLACKHFNLVNTLEDPALRAQIVRAINGKKLVDIKARLEQ